MPGERPGGVVKSILPNLVICMGVLLAGCAHRGGVVQTTRPAATQPVADALLRLDQLRPALSLPEAARVDDDSPAPSDALQLFAQGYDAQLRGERRQAISLYRSALEKDPDSFELNYALGVALLQGNPGDAGAGERLMRAAELRPDDVEVHLQLARYHLGKNDLDSAIRELRLARLSSEYDTREEVAAVVELFLARALQEKGYLSAALDAYELLLRRMQGRLNWRAYPEALYQLHRPEVIQAQVGELLEKLNRYQDALEHYRICAEADSDNLGYQARVARCLVQLGRADEARKLAVAAVVDHQANAESLAMLKDVLRETGRDDLFIQEIREALRGRPGDRALVLALSDALVGAGRNNEAEQLLAGCLESRPDDFGIITRLFQVYVEDGRASQAAKLIIDASASRPDSADELDVLWSRLIERGDPRRVRSESLRAMIVHNRAEAARLFWLARTAEVENRGALMRDSLRKAAEIDPPFAPAYRSLLNSILERKLSEQEKGAASNELVRRAQNWNRPELAAELRGRVAAFDRNYDQAIEHFENAQRLGNRSAALQYALATALLSGGHDARGEQVLTRITGEWPTLDRPQFSLFQFYLGKKDSGSAVRVLQEWLRGNPLSVSARLLQVRVLSENERPEAAIAAMEKLFRDEPHDPSVLEEMIRLNTRAGKLEQAIEQLEREHRVEPANLAVASALARTYVAERRMSDAVRVLDELRRAAAEDIQTLYFVAHLYEQAGHSELTEQVLTDVLRLDPENVSASNDLGYMWADKGRNLERAEKMIRLAVDGEPNNSAFLDSLGWVLYKQGKFEEASLYLRQATQQSDSPDPLVLDHLGDALYRLNNSAEAEKVWRQSLEQLGKVRHEREDLSQLRLQLRQKLDQLDKGEPVSVAPLANEPGGTQAKN